MDKLKYCNINTNNVLNKRSELAKLLSPDVIALTETLDKTRSMDPAPHELAIAGFDTNSNIDSKPSGGCGVVMIDIIHKVSLKRQCRHSPRNGYL